MLTRKANWDTRALHDFLLSRAKTPFQFGVNDCCLFVADAIQSFTDEDIASDFRNQYSDKAGAFRTIRKVTGGTTVADAAIYCANKYGLEEWKSPLFAQRGDLVLVEDNNELIAGIVHLNGRHVAVVGEDGLKTVLITAARRAWRV